MSSAPARTRRFAWRRLAALARKESIHLRRDPRSLAMAFAMPLVLLVLLVSLVPMAIYVRVAREGEGLRS